MHHMHHVHHVRDSSNYAAQSASPYIVQENDKRMRCEKKDR